MGSCYRMIDSVTKPEVTRWGLGWHVLELRIQSGGGGPLETPAIGDSMERGAWSGMSHFANQVASACQSPLSC